VTQPVREAELTTVRLSPEAVKRLGVDTAPVESRATPRSRSVGGEIIPPEGAVTIVTAPLAGTLLASADVPRAGAVVSAGDPLFRLVPIQPSDQATLADAQRALGTAVARQDAAVARVRRAERLVQDGAGSQRALEEARAELAFAEADLAAARARVASGDRVGSAIEGLVLEAPETAVIQAIHVTAGQIVSAGAPIVELAQLDRVWVRVALYAGEVENVARDQPARVVPLGSSADADSIEAQPVTAPLSANPGAATVDLYYALVNRGRRFRPGERVSVRLPRVDTATSLVVPVAAILHDAYGGTWVYEAVEPGLYTRQRVSVVDILGDEAMLGAGPDPGTRVVTDGAAELFGVEFGAGR
jgi:RND family efflux transporter MFP subunit